MNNLIKIRGIATNRNSRGLRMSKDIKRFRRFSSSSNERQAGETYATVNGCPVEARERIQATFRKNNTFSVSEESCTREDFDVRPFKRSAALKLKESRNTEESKNNVFSRFSLLNVACCYCEELISMHSNSCPHCRRGLKNYWLWEKAVFKRMLQLMGLALLALGVLVKILMVFTNI